MKRLGMTIFGCDQVEENIFHELAPHFDIALTMTSEPISPCSTMLKQGNRCISVSHKSAVSESCLSALQRAGVKYIATRSIGFDHINMKAAQRMGIAVGTASYAPDGVADYTLMLMLMAVRNAKHILTGSEKCDFKVDAVRGKELRDMTVGVVGTGHIGKAVIERLQGFGCRILTYNRSREAGWVPLEELLEKSDMITLHTPLNKETYHLIGHKELEIMKRGAFLVNTGRGGLVDTREMIKALETGKLGGAALDVLEGEEGLFYFDCSEKPIENQFLLNLQEMPNVIISPHTAYYTDRALYDIARKTLLNCLDFERSQSHV